MLPLVKCGSSLVHPISRVQSTCFARRCFDFLSWRRSLGLGSLGKRTDCPSTQPRLSRGNIAWKFQQLFAKKACIEPLDWCPVSYPRISLSRYPLYPVAHFYQYVTSACYCLQNNTYSIVVVPPRRDLLMTSFQLIFWALYDRLFGASTSANLIVWSSSPL